ncbi:MAG: SpoIID/LytB domain-containing protein [Candidatus Saccharicenans sp.]
MRTVKYFAGIFLALFLIVASPPEFGRENQFFQAYLIPKPVVRVGLLSNLKKATISSSSGMKIYEIGAEYRLLAEGASEVLVKVEKEILTEKFVLILAQVQSRSEAEGLVNELQEKLPGPVTLEERSVGGNNFFIIKYGEFLTRGQALSFIHELEKTGLKDIWIQREVVSFPEPGHLVLQIDHHLVSLDGKSDVYFIPSFQQSYLSLNGKPYRGIFILKRNGSGLSLINVLNLEDYLKGVVPLELSPGTFNALEALKAQAVAARTYALKNIGRNRQMSFDLTDTQSSQVYGGISVEHPLSNRAVEETAGEVIVYKGELIDALYTSTCGGMTEDAENVFSGKPLPYLKATSCFYEKQPEWNLETAFDYPAVVVRGRDILPEVAPLLAMDIFRAENKPGYFDQPVKTGELASSLEKVLSFKKINHGQLRMEAPDGNQTVDFRKLARWLVEFFGWQEKSVHFVLDSEARFILQNSPNRSELKEGEARLLAYLLQSGIFPSYLREENLNRPVTRAEFIYILRKSLPWLEDYFHDGVFLSSKGHLLEVQEKAERKLLNLSDRAILIRRIEEGQFTARKLNLVGGENIRWLEYNGRVLLLEVIYPPNSNVLDRNSRYNRWVVRVKREDLEKNILRYYPKLGSLVDVKVLKRGSSNRVVELQIIGTNQTITVSGLRVKWVLNLRDTLFFIDREYLPDQKISHFIFTGRGWGHGVGLCQVGAYGLAIAGANYREILSHYYRNTRVEKIH